MNWTLVIVLFVTAIGSWWLSGYDTRLSGQEEHRSADLLRRSSRCAITLVLIGFGVNQFLKGGVFQAFIGVIIMLPLTPFWIGCLSELSARGFMGLVDREDNRQFDARQLPRDLDRLAGLVRDGRNDEAIRLCAQLRESAEVSALAIETVLFQLYQEKFSEERIARSPALSEAQRLREQQHFPEAVTRLDALLKQEPWNLPAALLWMRIHAEDLQRPDLATARLQILDRQPHVPPVFTDYARRCIGEWSGTVPRRPKTTENVESLLVNRTPDPASLPVPDNDASVDQLLATGRLATAIEILEDNIRAQPQDYESWLKLVEAYGAFCRDFARAGKVVDKIAVNPAFSPEQIRLAKEKLKDWRALRSS